MPKGMPNWRYTPEYKKQVTEPMRREKPGRSRTKRKGLQPVLHRLQALSAAYLNSSSDFCQTFWGSVHIQTGLLQSENPLVI